MAKKELRRRSLIRSREKTGTMLKLLACLLLDKTLVNRTQGAKTASEGLKFRVFEVSLADLQNDNDAERSFRKFKLIAEDVQCKNVLTNFHGMDLTTDKLRSIIKKW